MEQAVKWIELNRDAPKNHLYLTTHEDPYTVIGGIGLKPGGDIESHTGEVGYWLAETHWGSGLITEALEGFVSYTFLERDGDGSAPVEGKPAEVKKTRIFATVVNGNTASMRILEKCGFKKEGVQKEHVRIRNGTLCDVHMYGLTKGDWDEWRRERGS
ncbi:hypothetical protein N0V90_010300 [Kalmusia sp. IMI 367209]|nr:hypothetical protein N0V90_010300 [Kalmusia sp. IMI 367209]